MEESVMPTSAEQPCVPASDQPDGTDRPDSQNQAAASGEPAGEQHDDQHSDSATGTQSSQQRERKKGVPWTEEEHRLFLLGLQKLGKGDWRGISKHYVSSRSPTQVASHAQKYFIRQSNLHKRKRRSSLFDLVPEPDVTSSATSGCHEGELAQARPAGLPNPIGQMGFLPQQYAAALAAAAAANSGA
jgi:SHAQKYF class myb-like DNA-binding protein